jgi:hypothetical protein
MLYFPRDVDDRQGKCGTRDDLPLWSPRLHSPYNHGVDDVVVWVDYDADVEDGEDCFSCAVEFLEIG